ncbi:MAG TPA: cytochrome c biogenesis protein CcdA [Candidatus Paceibacterota bacterium]|nr:cytochrome c biogenesis protein CcdA [Candidatus Paceibacterota bacterium]
MEPLSLTLMVSAVLAGVLMFLAPCTLPLIPAFLAYLSGTTSATSTPAQRRRTLLTYTLCYCAGFSVVFITLGILAGLIGGVFATYQTVFTQLGGVFVIAVGATLIGVPARLGWRPASSQTLPIPTHRSPAVAFGLGVAFALGWTPCIGPLLATILLFASSTATVATGTLLLTLFALGLTIPFLLTALLFDRVAGALARSGQTLQKFNYVAGWLLIGLGFLLVTNSLRYVFDAGYWLFALLGLDVLYQFF